MEQDKQPVVVEHSIMGAVEPMALEQAQRTFKMLQAFIAKQMKKDTDYGIIPGCKKPSLYKPGAEKLLFFHGLGCKLEPISADTVVDWNRPFFNYAYRAVIFNQRTQAVIATADGSCNSYESKYRYIWLTEAKLPRGFDKNGATTKEDSYGRTLYRFDNPEVFGLPNTISKMAQKRAMIAATLIACRASDSFTPDAEAETEGGAQQEQAAPKSKPDASGYNESEKISEPRLKRYHAIKAKAGKSDEEILSFFQRVAAYCVVDGVVKPERISFKHYDAITNWLEGKA